MVYAGCVYDRDAFLFLCANLICIFEPEMLKFWHEGNFARRENRQKEGCLYGTLQHFAIKVVPNNQIQIPWT
jgi:hypothetical protein